MLNQFDLFIFSRDPFFWAKIGTELAQLMGTAPF